MLGLLIFSSCDWQSKKQLKNDSSGTFTNSEFDVDFRGLSKTEGRIKTVYGNIKFKFYPLQAPNTVRRIIELINQGFYDGLTFHRVVPNTVIQGGDPSATGLQGSGKILKAEFSSLKHVPGTMGMARSESRDSADSQFYIVLKKLPELDNKYTIFGQVVSGLSVLSKIKQGDKMISVTLKNLPQ